MVLDMMKKFVARLVIIFLFVTLITGFGIFNRYTWQSHELEVVKIKVVSDYGNVWQGSGVFVDDDLILTAGHMVESAHFVQIIWADGRECESTKWYLEHETDLGVICVETPEKESKVKFSNAVVGEEVWALGNPLGVFPVLTKGIVSAIDMSDDYSYQKNMIITDCAINPGNSGCPLFNENGDILGICSWGYNYAQGMSYFVRAEICELTLLKYYAIEALENAE